MYKVDILKPSFENSLTSPDEENGRPARDSPIIAWLMHRRLGFTRCDLPRALEPRDA